MRDDLDAADQCAAADFPHARLIEGRDDVGLTIRLQQHRDFDAAAGSRIPDAIAIEQLADPSRVFNRLFRLQLRPLVPGAEDLVVAGDLD